jgi:hypothetical protein
MKRTGAEYTRHINAVIKEHANIALNAYLSFAIYSTFDYLAPIRILRVKAKFNSLTQSWAYLAKALNTGRWMAFDPDQDRITFN